MRLLVIISVLLVLGFPFIMTEVVESFSKCSNFFFEGEPPKIEGVLKDSTSQDNTRYKLICQKYKNYYRFATLYDTTMRIPIFSAYKYTGHYGKTPRIQWMMEPQVMFLMVDYLHVLQRRIGCEIEKQGHEFKFSKGVYEFSYDGEDFLSFDNKESQWVAADDTALLTKRKWENEPIINQYTKSYLEKDCVKWLNKYREYADEELRNISAPDVHVFARKCIKEDFKLKLTCMATGVYSKDVMMIIRKNHTSLPEYEMNSTVVQPNHDGSFQIRKTVEIEEDDDDEAEYDCLVSHRTLNESIIVTWDRLCSECPLNTVAAGFVGVVSGGVIMLAISALVFGILVERKNIGEYYEDSRNRLSAVSTEALTQPDDL
ncbi:H-2 class I histocompatibility antigen, K-D alpha chain [Anabarilius grahami]|uniref:H-2 class I histocompatibility antigen, K-D alpha chain n=1 Tax=Anabarilius grahami TaxID=495550 RepID=A0A3N0Y551_ANAGA|nr:H-2 class I histocompatibility antigen, K-D alpha chain [Anabarilius grahami]